MDERLTADWLIFSLLPISMVVMLSFRCAQKHKRLRALGFAVISRRTLLAQFPWPSLRQPAVLLDRNHSPWLLNRISFFRQAD